MTRQPMGLFDGFTNAERDDLLYGYFSAASDVGGHLPPVRGLARIFVRRRKLQVFTSGAGSGRGAVSVLQIDPALISARRRIRLASRRRARQGGC